MTDDDLALRKDAPLKIHTYGTWADISVPRKLDDGMVRAVQAAVEKGLTFNGIAAICGISGESLRRWRVIGEEAYKLWFSDENQIEDLDMEYFPLHVRPYIQLYQAIQIGHAKAQERWLDQIDKAAETEGAWQAAAWRLERVYPKQFGRRVTIEDDGAPHVLVTADDLVHAQAEIRAWEERRMSGAVIEGESRELNDDGDPG